MTQNLKRNTHIFLRNNKFFNILGKIFVRYVLYFSHFCNCKKRNLKIDLYNHISTRIADRTNLVRSRALRPVYL